MILFASGVVGRNYSIVIMTELTTTNVITTLDELDLLDLSNTGPWPSEPDNEDTHEIDWHAADNWKRDDRLDVGEDYDAWGRVGDTLRERASGGPRVPPSNILDCDAWYLPIHFYGPSWAIYIRESAILRVAGDIMSELPTSRRHDTEVVAGATRAALSMLYLHEAFHHKVESLAIRLEIIEHRRRYVPYFNDVYALLTGTSDHLEEGLACAEMVRRLNERTYRRWIPNDVHQASKRILRGWIPRLPPGYNRGIELAKDAEYRAARNDLSSQIHEGRKNPMRRPHEWDLTPNTYRGLFNCLAVTRVVVPVGAWPIVPWFNTGPLGLSISTRDLSKVLGDRGYELKKGQGKGSHLKYTAAGRRMIILPAGRKSLSYRVLQTTAEALELSSVGALGDLVG